MYGKKRATPIRAIVTAVLFACIIVFVLALCSKKRQKMPLHSGTPVAVAQTLVDSRIASGSHVDIAKRQATALGFEMGNLQDDGKILNGIIRGSTSLWNPVGRSLQIRIYVGPDQLVTRVECAEGFTGP